GIERSRERSLGPRHLAGEPADGLGCALAVERFSGAHEGEGEKLQQLRIVVEHLFEMWHQPALVDRVAGKGAAQGGVDAALADAVEGDLDEGEVTLVAGAQAGAP